MKPLTYYVYVYLDPRKPGAFTYGVHSFDFEPFYIGKGQGLRKDFHLHCYDSEPNGYKTNKIKKIIKLGLIPISLFIRDNIFNEQEAFNLEIESIKTIGRFKHGNICDWNIGPLVNLTGGGEGVSGLKMSDASKKLMSDKRKKFLENPENREKAIAQLRKFELENPGWQKGEGGYWFGKTMSKSHRSNQSKSIKKFHKENPGIWEGENASMFGKKHSNETLLKMKEAQLGEKSYHFGKRGKNTPNFGKGKPVIQMTKDGKEIKEWPNAWQIYKELGISGAYKCCIGLNTISGGFKWKFKQI